MMSKRVLVPLAAGFEEIESVTVIDILRRTGADVVVAGLTGKSVTGSHRIIIIADALLDEVKDQDFDLIVLPGGMPGAKNLKADSRVQEIVRRHEQAGKLIAAICAAPIVLADAGILENRKFTVHPAQVNNIRLSAQDLPVEVDQGVITGQAAGAAMKFAFTLVEQLYGPEKVWEINRSVLFRE
jgi:4-methyl-5(b-hydroxyethyl)-thiazole monophosphate biosynthesis